MKHTLALVATLVLMASCSISYKFNGASINYDKVKTITIEDFANRASYVWAPWHRCSTPTCRTSTCNRHAFSR